VDRRPRWTARTLAVLACLVCAGALLSGSVPGGGPGPHSLRILQLNLCDSGIAGCYTGRAVPRAAAVIASVAPDIVTLNEVCRSDVAVLAAALGGGGRHTVGEFRPAIDRRTGEPFHCVNGEDYGIGLLVRVPAVPVRVSGGVYPPQDTNDPEERVWLCVQPTGGVNSCTTHLASTSATVALAQCRYLLGTALPGLESGGRNDPTVLAGDFNLGDLRGCLQAGDAQAGDGGVQHVIATPGATLAGAEDIDLARTTDHPGLLVTLVIVTSCPCPGRRPVV
jgi:endonuclease/exonuclease/phosphatase family metal-dependent hydrolase